MRAAAELHKKKQGKRKYKAIAKVGANHFVKYRTNDLDKFLIFLQKKFPGVLYVNFFYGKGPEAGKQFASWGKNKGMFHV